MHDEDLEEVAWDADEVAAPLDLLLSGSTLGVARRLCRTRRRAGS